MSHAIYTRNDDGTIVYQGNQDWLDMTQQDVAEFFLRGHESPTTENMAGWPHASVVWYGNLGFGVQ